ncbi:hypothetical protein PSAC2689_60334 [Paraburkholderia sacchari]
MWAEFARYVEGRVRRKRFESCLINMKWGGSGRPRGVLYRAALALKKGQLDETYTWLKQHARVSEPLKDD